MGGRLAMVADANVALVMGTRSPRVLHLASHGGFLPGVEAEPDGSGPGDPLAEHPVDATTALRRAVVVLAGANRGGTGEGDDGYLAALEVSLMHLEQTRLVTLSACETNRGEIRTGEGVYGLRRALTVAGARTSLLSLWKVNDDATSELMGTFYAHLARGEEPHRALEAAQATFRDQQDGRLRHPFWWAGFQLYGP
jgi:CHAT domain-containing protein